MTDQCLCHRNYVGSIEVSIEDGCLYGKILHVRDLVTYEAENPADLKTAFEKAVDAYLEKCAELQVDPDKPFSGTFNVRIDPETHRDAAVCASRKGASLNEFVAKAIHEMLAVENGDRTHKHEHVHTHTTQVITISQSASFGEPEPQWQQANLQPAKRPH